MSCILLELDVFLIVFPFVQDSGSSVFAVGPLSWLDKFVGADVHRNGRAVGCA